VISLTFYASFLVGAVFTAVQTGFTFAILLNKESDVASEAGGIARAFGTVWRAFIAFTVLSPLIFLSTCNTLRSVKIVDKEIGLTLSTVTVIT
jgi:uncharacterized ion transporter superfamily protein YfcC